jgi:D-alanine-D-alanine ligase
VLEAFHQPALVEDFIDGREFHISLLGGDGQCIMLPPAEMDFSAFRDVRERLCTFDSKFTPGSAHYKDIRLRIAAGIDPSEYKAMEATACAAYQILGCRDYARIDIRLRDGVFYVLDVNPNADISVETSIVCAAEAAGYSYGAMLSHLIHLASQRHPRFTAEGAQGR